MVVGTKGVGKLNGRGNVKDETQPRKRLPPLRDGQIPIRAPEQPVFVNLLQVATPIPFSDIETKPKGETAVLLGRSFQQTLSLLLAWDLSGRRRLRCDTNGGLFTTDAGMVMRLLEAKNVPIPAGGDTGWQSMSAGVLYVRFTAQIQATLDIDIDGSGSRDYEYFMYNQYTPWIVVTANSKWKVHAYSGAAPDSHCYIQAIGAP